MNNRTDYLFARQSFTRGVGRILDINGATNIYNVSKNEKDADFKALKNDWSVVGEDLMAAIKNHE